MDKASRYRVETRTRSSTITGVIILGLIVFAVFLPAFASRSLIQDVFFILTMLVLAQFWNLLAGYGGLVSVGQQAFVGLGAYSLFGASILLGWNPVYALLLSGLFAVAFAIPMAYFVFRLQGAYFAVGTWVSAEIARLSIAQWKSVGGGSGTSLPRAAREAMFGSQWVQEVFGVRAPASRDIVVYWLALFLVIATIGGIYWLLRTKRGLALAAIRDNSEAAKAVGVDASRMKWLVFLVAAFGTGVAGGLIFLQNGRISPNSAFAVQDWTAYVIFIVVIGGIGTIEGPIIGVLVFFALQTLFADYGAWYLIALGAFAIAIMLFYPKGLWGLISDKMDLQLFPIKRRLRGGDTER